MLAGVVVVPIDYRASPVILRRVQEIVDCPPHPDWRGSSIACLGDASRLPGDSPISNGRQREALPIKPRHLSIDQDDIAEIVFTSGATGEPKGVLITHGNILANLSRRSRSFRDTASGSGPCFPLRFLSLIPLSHMFGQALTMFILPLIPGVAVFMRGYSPHEIVRQIRTRRVSVVVAVPKILEVLREDVLRRFPEAARSATVA